MTDQPYAMSFLPYLRLGLGADAKAGLTYLFDALPNTVAKLAIGAPTAELRGQFQNSGIRLTQQARVEKQPAGNDWKVIDSDAVYLIRSESPAVRVYAVDNLHRSKVVHTLVKNQAGTTLWTDSHAAVLRGPGDIIGFHDHLIARTEPVSGATDFEPNYFPFIEFKDPDFPWRYSLGAPDTAFRLLPWIVLLVLPSGSFATARRTLNDRQHVNALHVEDAAHQPDKLCQLPDLQSAWAWAHVQFSAGATIDKDDLAASLRDQPEMNCARLLCPRRLKPRTSYSAFVVPLSEIGRRAGLGEPLRNPGEDDSQLSTRTWNPDAAVDLPIYYRWDFQTCEAGDFEDLIHKIKPGTYPTGIGMRKVDGGAASNADFLPKTNGGEFNLEGALVPMRATASPGLDFKDPFAAVVAGELGRALESLDGDEDPLVTIPIYGQHYKRLFPTFFNQADAGSGKWIQEINLDRQYRIPGGMGTQVVQTNQEDYMDLCWKQIGEIQAANEEIRRAATGALIGERLQARHLDKLEGGRFLAVMGPFHHYAAETGGRRAAAGESYQRRFARTGVPWGALSTAGRKAFIHRSQLHGSGAGAAQPFARYLQSRLDPASALVKSTPQANPRAALMAASPLRADTVSVKAFPAGEVASFRTHFNLRADILSRLNSMINPGSNLPPIEFLEPRLAAPKITYPMYAHLAALSMDFFIPNLQNLKNNTVVLFSENRKFIEAYLVGLNHEMCRELVWREYPTDSRATVFSHFWESIGPDGPQADIQLIDAWTQPLGANKPSGPPAGSANPPPKNRTIFALKADLIRRYPDAVFSLVQCDLPEPMTDEARKAAWTTYFSNTDQEKPTPGFTVFEPEISAQIGKDTLFLGYPIEPLLFLNNPKKYNFVIAQIPSLPRFGLDSAAANEPGSIDDFSWGQVKSGKGDWIDLVQSKPAFKDAEWNSATITGAGIAQFTLQLPIRLVIPAARLVQTN